MFTTDRKKVWLIPAGMCLVSTIFCFIVLGVGCPEAWSDGDWSKKREEIGMSCGALYDKGIYKPSPTRISPYGFGMFAAYLFLEQVKVSKQENGKAELMEYLQKPTTVILEIVCFIFMIIISWFGA